MGGDGRGPCQPLRQPFCVWPSGRSQLNPRRVLPFRPAKYQPTLKPTLGRMVPVMPAQAGIHDFGRIDPQAVDGRNKPGHDGTENAYGSLPRAPGITCQCPCTHPGGTNLESRIRSTFHRFNRAKERGPRSAPELSVSSSYSSLVTRADAATGPGSASPPARISARSGFGRQSRRRTRYPPVPSWSAGARATRLRVSH